jgi:hypothetical protein
MEAEGGKKLHMMNAPDFLCNFLYFLMSLSGNGSEVARGFSVD